MTKVMISLPQALLDRIDDLAEERGLTRSGLLRDLAERQLDAAEEERRAEMKRLLELATKPRGGDSARLIREDRDSR